MRSAFRVPWALQMIPAIFLFFGMMFLPESPRWLARKDRWEECLDVLALVHCKGDRNHPFVVREYEEIRQYCEFEQLNADVTYMELLKPNMINRTHIGIFTQIWSQLTGMNVMMYYITYVFAMAGLKGNNLLVSSSIQYVINVAMTVPALLYVDRWGRRPTLLSGALLMAVWLFSNAGILGKYGVHRYLLLTDTCILGLAHLTSIGLTESMASVKLQPRSQVHRRRLSLPAPTSSSPPTRLPGVQSHGSTHPNSTHSACVVRLSLSPRLPIGRSISLSAISSHLHLSTFSGVPTSFLVYSASPCLCMSFSCSQRLLVSLLKK